MSKGFMYIAVGDQYLREAEYSAEQLDNIHPDKPISVVTNEQPSSSVFDQIIEPEPGEGWDLKIKNMKNIPYDKTIYLDTDTYVSGDLTDLFRILDDFNVFCVRKQDYYVRESYHKSIPDSYPEFNTGVLGFNKCGKVEELMSEWETSWAENRMEMTHDQQPFRFATYKMDNLELTQIGPEYNCRFTLPGLLTREAKIFHARPENKPFGSDSYNKYIKKVEKKINRNPRTPRVFISCNNKIHIYYCPTQNDSLHTKALKSLQYRGPIGFSKHIFRKYIKGTDRYDGILQ